PHPSITLRVGQGEVLAGLPSSPASVGLFGCFGRCVRRAERLDTNSLRCFGPKRARLVRVAAPASVTARPCRHGAFRLPSSINELPSAARILAIESLRRRQSGQLRWQAVISL